MAVNLTINPCQVNDGNGGQSSLQFLASDPSTFTGPTTWFNTTEGVMKIYDGTSIIIVDINNGDVVDAFGVNTGIDV